MKYLIVFLILFIATILNGQKHSSASEDSASNRNEVASNVSALTLDGYIETYYVFDGGKPSNHTRPGYIYSHNRHNEFNLNIGMIRASLKSDRYRANLALMGGTYSNANLAAESATIRNIYEANGGVKLSKKKNLWVDAGIFTSHIGYESAIGKDCWTMTRSMTADNTPYYESGVKLTYTSNSERWLLSALLLNGWQRIQRVDGNNVLCTGTQITYKAGDKLLFNSSTFVGSDQPDSTLKMRYFHDFYGTWQLHPKITLLAGFDVGAQQRQKGSDVYDTWYSSSFLVKIKTSERTTLAMRYENYIDKKGIIIASQDPNGFIVSSGSINVDVHATENILWRLESKVYASKDKVLISNNTPSYYNFVFGSALAITLN